MEPFGATGTGWNRRPDLDRPTVVQKGSRGTLGYWPGIHSREGAVYVQSEMASPNGCTARICWARSCGRSKCRTRRRTLIPASFSRTGCTTATAGRNGAAAPDAPSHQIGGQRVERAAQYAAISHQFPAPLGGSSRTTASAWKRRLIGCMREDNRHG